MSVKKSKKKPIQPNANRETARRTRILQIIAIILSVMLVLSLVLSLTSQ
jgi:hypothetical protein